MLQSRTKLELILTCARHFEGDAETEITSILHDLGDDEPHVTTTNFSGILTVKTSIPHTEIIEQIGKKIQDEPWTIRYISRIIPMFDVMNCEMDSIVKAAASQARKIKPDETYRITIEKRDSDIQSSEIITKIASMLENKVSLEEYDWIILIETIGDVCGVSVLKDDDVLSVERLKRSLLE